MKTTLATLTLLVSLAFITSSGNAIASTNILCPAGYICKPTVQTISPLCPTGYICTLKSTTNTQTNTSASTYVPGSYYNTFLSNLNIRTTNVNTNIKSNNNVTTTNSYIPQVISPETVSVVESPITESPVIVQDIQLDQTTATIIPGTYQFTVNYSQSLDDILSVFAKNSLNNATNAISGNISFGMFPQSGSGQKTLNAKVFSLADLVANISGTVTYDQLMYGLKTKGYRPVTLQELIALSTMYPQIAGTAYGSIIKVTGSTTSSYFAPFVNTGSSSPMSLGKTTGSSSGGGVGYQKIMSSNGNIIGPATSNSGNTIYVVMGVGKIIAVQDNTWTPVTLTSMPSITLGPSAILAAATDHDHYAIPSAKYTVQVDYSKYRNPGWQNIYEGTGVQPAEMKILQIVDTDAYIANILGFIKNSRVGSDEVLGYLMPAGYRAATAAEMVSFEKQYPLARGNYGLIALGSQSPTCNAYPWFHNKPGPAGSGEEPGFEHRGLFDIGSGGGVAWDASEGGLSAQVAAAPRYMMNPTTAHFLYPIVKIQ